MISRPFTLACIAGVLAAGTAQAAYFVQWQNRGTGLALEDGTPLLPNVGDQALFQLVFAGPDGVANPESYPGQPGGDDQLLSTEIFQNTTGSSIEQYAANFKFALTEGLYQAPGLLYVRVFNGTTIDAGTEYITSELLQTTDIDRFIVPPIPPDVLTYDFGAPGGIAILESHIIPEPSSLAILSVGGVVLIMRRRYVGGRG